MKILNGFMDWYHGNNNCEKEPPRGGLRRVGYILWNYAGRLMAVNVLFLLCCIPVVTIPAAVSALNSYVGKIFRRGYGFSMEDFWKEFRGGIFRYIPLGLLVGALGFYAYYLLSLAGNFGQGTQRDIVAGVGLGALIIAVLLGSYVFVLTSALELPNRHILRNAFILMFLEWRISLLLAAETLVFWGAVLGTAPYSLPVLALFAFSAQQVVTAAMLGPVVERRILTPYANTQMNQNSAQLEVVENQKAC